MDGRAIKLGAMPRSSLLEGAAKLVAKLKEAGHESYFVGGAPRDLLLGLAPKDVDIATAALPEDVEKLFERTHRIGACFGVVTVVVDGHCYEVASFREERDYMDGRHPELVQYTKSPELDVIRRDFTVNGLLLDPESRTVIDYVGGVEDLRRGLLRTIGDPNLRFAEDHLRTLRAIRFCVRFRLEMDSATRNAIPAFAKKTASVSAERFRDELNKMLAGPEPSRALRMLLELGLLKERLPELAALDGLPQPPEHHPEGDVFTHTMIMLDHMAKPDLDLAWAILLHDVGKKATFGHGPDGRIHFYGHESVGERMAVSIMERMKTPRDSIKAVASAVRNHMKFAHVHLMRQPKWRRMLADPNFPLELELHRIDCISSHAKLGNYILMLDRLAGISGERALPVSLLNGRDLIDLGMKPGPEIGKALHLIGDLQLDYSILTKEDAVEALKNAGFIA